MVPGDGDLVDDDDDDVRVRFRYYDDSQVPGRCPVRLDLTYDRRRDNPWGVREVSRLLCAACCIPCDDLLWS